MRNSLRQFLVPTDKVLLAVSGGADSRVLLDLMENAGNEIDFGVVHVDHQLRQESAMEAAFLEEYCRIKKIPFYLKRWEEPPISGIEASARAFRYTFFEEIMTAFGYNKLMTAHHADDQAETLVMRLIRGGSFASHQGIKSRQPFGSGELIRPLLAFSKKELLDYANQHQLTYFEDASNESLVYTRNRIRQRVIPMMKEENPQFLQQTAHFHQQLVWAQELMDELLTFEAVESSEDNFRFSIEFIQTKTTAYRYYWLTAFFKRFVNGLIVSQKQMMELLELLENGASQWTVDLEDGWQFKRRYQTLQLTRKVNHGTADPFSLTNGDQFFLNDHEWIALVPINEALPELPETKGWQRYEVDLPEKVKLPLVLRHRQPGDRIQLTESLRKKINRIFVDEKIPLEKRDRCWIVSDAASEILAVLPFKNSYLSIKKETDKIHYRLLYKYYFPK